MSSRKTGETAVIKVPETTRSKIRLGAAVLGMTMQEVTENAVTEFIGNGRDMLEANQNAILASEPIPFPIEIYAEELAKRRAA